MALTCTTKHTYQMNVLNVMYVEVCGTLHISDMDDNEVEFDVDPDTMMCLARNLFCARDKVTEFTKNKEVTLSHAKEIVKHLTQYINEHEIKDADK